MEAYRGVSSSSESLSMVLIKLPELYLLCSFPLSTAFLNVPRDALVVPVPNAHCDGVRRGGFEMVT